MPEDRAITSSKSDVDPCRHGRVSDRQISADGQTDRQMAFQLYIVKDVKGTLDSRVPLGREAPSGAPI